MTDGQDLALQLEGARATIAAQATQLTALQQEIDRGSSRAALREVIDLSEIAGAIMGRTPYRSLLEGIAVASRRLFDAGAAGIMLLDHQTNELVFEAASGGSEDIVNRRFPAHLGIAGWVVMTGEPIAVADVQRDPRFARDFAQSTGYMPRSILAVPLLVGDEVEGVLEVLDKSGAGSFGLEDMDMLTLFAQPAGRAVEQARMVANMGTLLVEEIGRLAERQGEAALVHAAAAAASSQSLASEGTIELARLVQTLTKRSDRARRIAIDVLTSVAANTG